MQKSARAWRVPRVMYLYFVETKMLIANLHEPRRMSIRVPAVQAVFRQTTISYDAVYALSGNPARVLDLKGQLRR